MQENHQHKLVVLGSGNFGTCLAHHLGWLGHQVALWCRNKESAGHINKHHRNPRYLSDITLSPNIKAFTEPTAEIFAEATAVVVAVPTQVLRSCMATFAPFINPAHVLICAAKGIEVGTDKRPSQIITDILGAEYGLTLACLSGPSFASEIAAHLPTAVSLASRHKERALMAQQLFHSPYFRVYTSDDIIGLEIAGALKNVIAIGAGACQGLGFQANSLAALITRGLAEMTRVGTALGANPLTFIGLGGVGDLFLTCSSEKSRNFRVGYLLGQGMTLPNILNQVNSVAEGVATTTSAYHLGNALKVSIPITTAIYSVLYEGRPVKEAVHDLINRPGRDER